MVGHRNLLVFGAESELYQKRSPVKRLLFQIKLRIYRTRFYRLEDYDSTADLSIVHVAVCLIDLVQGILADD